jgi:hypothetical protein
MDRRTFLKLLAAGTVPIAGCGLDQRVSGGDVRVTNQDDSAHTVTIHLREIEKDGRTETFETTPPQRREITVVSGKTETIESFIPSDGWLLVAETDVGDRSREVINDGACVIITQEVGRVNIKPGDIC